MDTIQIEITNACINECSNCTRFVGHARPYHMDVNTFEQAVESMVDYPKMTGIMGGEPLLHPKFEQFCKYLQDKIPKEQLGLWTCLPKGYEYLRHIICDTFGNIFINDHSRNDIYHCPILVASEEIFTDSTDLFLATEHCWIQEAWSAAINPKGAFFCEIAASMSILFNGSYGWPVEKGWWKRTSKDFKEQREEFCPKCGAALPLERRISTEKIDDISPKNYDRLKDKSIKIKKGLYQISDLKLIHQPQQMAAYKNPTYRARIASRYGIYLHLNKQRFLTPVLSEAYSSLDKTIFEEYKDAFGAK
jgi:hypothetical protein